VSVNPLIGSLVFAASLIVIVLILLSGRSILRLLLRGPLGRFVLRPLYNVTFRPVFWLLRRIGRLARGAASPAQKEAQARIGTVPYSAMAQVISAQSLAEQAMGEVPAATRRLIRRQGLIFRTANANEAVDSLKGTLSLDDAKRNLESARHYYEEPMGKNASPGFLYEDSEEALIIRILKDVDLTFFHVMRRINRNIRRNVVKIIAIMTGIVLIFPFVISAVRLIPVTEAAFGWTLYAVTCALFATLLWLFRLFYGNATRINGQNFNYFVQTYFGRLLSQYKSADTAFESVPNDRTSDLETVQRDASVWFLNLHWLSARQWFLELYVRNMIFQIARNLWLSYLAVPMYFIVAGAIYLVLSHVAQSIPALHSYSWEPDWRSWTVFAPLLFLLAIYWWALNGLLAEFWTAITSNGWLGFQTMNVDGMIERHIGRNVREMVDKRRDPMGRHSYPD
jgi:hypothetical protein